MTGDEMTMILVLMVISFIVIHPIDQSAFKNERIALWLSYCCTVLGITFITNTKVGLLLSILSFLIALLFPKFRAACTLIIAKLFYPPGRHSVRIKRIQRWPHFLHSIDTPTNSNNEFGSSCMNSNFGHDFAQGYGTGVSDGSPGSSAGAASHHHW